METNHVTDVPVMPAPATNGTHMSAEQIAEIAGAVAELQATRVAEDAAERATTGAKSGPHSQFLFAPNGPRENKIHDIGARDDEH